jgi:hypothetical protein
MVIVEELFADLPESINEGEYETAKERAYQSCKKPERFDSQGYRECILFLIHRMGETKNGNR